MLTHGVETVQAVEYIWAGKNGGVLLAAVGREADCAGCLGILVKYGGFRRSKREVAS